MSKSIPMALSIVMAALLAGGAYAQTKGGEADPAQSKGPVVKKATPMEKADARAARKAGGSAAAKADASTPVGKDDTAGDSSAKHPAVAKRTAEEKAAARAQRKAGAVAAAKKGEIPKAGEAGPGTTK